MNTRTFQMLDRLQALGFTAEEAFQIRRISMTLHRWSELECGDGNDYASWSIERDEETDKPYRCVYPHQGTVSCHKTRIPDREKGALKRLAKIMEAHPELVSYHQGDPRGASLYIVKKSDLNGSDIDSTYTRGIAVHD